MRQSELLISISKLSKHQRECLNRTIINALKLNDEYQNKRPDTCPCCGNASPMIKKGKRNNKQRFLCKDCNRVFTYDTGTITSYSKIELSKFQAIVLDTLSCIPIKTTAANHNVNVSTVFEIRHKLLAALEHVLTIEGQLLSGTVEIDETYELQSEKGSRAISRKARHRGEPSNYRGLSHEQICIVTTTDRNGHEIFKAVGSAKPTSAIILENFSEKIVSKSIIYSDGATCYDQLASKVDCKIVHLKDKNDYNQVEHINTVNSIHSMIQQQMIRFRGVATKYINRYMSLMVFVRRFIDMDDNEKIHLLLPVLRDLKFNITRKALRNHNLFDR